MDASVDNVEKIDDSSRLRYVLIAGVAGTFGAVLAYLGAFGFAGAMVDLGLGVAFALVARVALGQLRKSSRPAIALPSRLAVPLSALAAAYFAIGFAVFVLDVQAPDLGRIDEQELDFFALAQEQEGGKTYSARFKVQPPGAYDRARIAFGSLDRKGDETRVTELDFKPIGDAARSVERIEPGPEHRAALLFRRVPGAVDVAVMLRAELETNEKPPEVLYVSVAAQYGKRDLAWHVARHYRQRY